MGRITRKLIITILIALVNFSIFAQFNIQNRLKADSMKLELKKLSADSVKYKYLIKLMNYYGNFSLDTADIYANLIESIIVNLKNEDKITSFYNNIASIHRRFNDYDKALFYVQKGIKYDRIVINKINLSTLYTTQSDVYKSMKQLSNAINSGYVALSLSDSAHNPSQYARTLSSLSNVYLDLSNYKKGLELAERSFEINRILNNKGYLSLAYNNLATLYFYLKIKQDSVPVYYNRYIKLSHEISDYTGEALGYINLGAYYEKINKDSMLINHLRGYELSKKLKYKRGLFMSLYNLSLFYLNEQEYISADKYVNEYYSFAKSENNLEALSKSTSIKYAILKGQKEFAKALEYYELYTSYHDSLLKLSNNSEINKIELKYTFGKKALKDSMKLVEQNIIFKSNMREQQLINNAQQVDIKLKNLLLAKSKGDLKARELKIKQDVISKKLKDKEISEKSLELRQELNQKKYLLILIALIGALMLLAIFGFLRQRRLKKIIDIEKKEVELQRELTNRQKELIEEKHKEITDSIHYAERIQKSFLATDYHLNKNLKEYFILFKPKDVVSGDFYWSANLNNDNFALVTADSTGHGVPGAIMSLLNITSLEKAIETKTEASDILNKTRKIIIERLKKDGSLEGGKDGMDCSLCVYDFKKMKLYIAAANNPVWIFRNSTNSVISEVIEIQPDKMPVGKHDKQNIPFTLHEIELQKGDVVYNLTDGFPDQFGGEKGKKFMRKKLRELLSKIAHLSMNEQKQLLEKTFADWVGGLEQVDDVTVIGVRV